MDARVLKFHMHIPHKKWLTRIFSYPTYAPFLSYVPLITKFENLVCKISQKVFELELSIILVGAEEYIT